MVMMMMVVMMTVGQANRTTTDNERMCAEFWPVNIRLKDQEGNNRMNHT
jgi:hypothetical protein